MFRDICTPKNIQIVALSLVESPTFSAFTTAFFESITSQIACFALFSTSSIIIFFIIGAFETLFFVH